MWASFSGQTSQIIFFYVHDECSLKLLQWQFVYFFHCGSSIIMMNMKQPWLVKVPRPHSFWNLRILVGPCSIILGYSRGQVLVAKIKWNPSTRVAILLVTVPQLPPHRSEDPKVLFACEQVQHVQRFLLDIYMGLVGACLQCISTKRKDRHKIAI
jgi:hypothetical protein